MKLWRTCPDLVISFPLYANSALLALVIDAGKKALEAGTLILHLSDSSNSKILSTTAVKNNSICLQYF